MTGATGFTVVIPLYNKRAFVRAAVDSVLAQQFAPFELIVVDDGSTDGGPDLLADIEDRRLRIVTQPNAGVAAARNRGIAEARKPWIALLDADDLWRPNHLAELATILAERPEAGLIATGVQQTRVGRPIDALRRAPRRVREVDYFAEAADDILLVNSSVAALRRDLIRDLGGFRDLRPGEDIDCWSRLALAAPVAVSNQQTAFYARDTGGAMAVWAGRMRTRRDISRLQDFGGAVQSLADALATGRFEARRASIERYIDARILSGVAKCLVSGDVANARNRLRFVHGRRSRDFWLKRALAALPAPATRRAIAAVKRLRAWAP